MNNYYYFFKNLLFFISLAHSCYHNTFWVSMAYLYMYMNMLKCSKCSSRVRCIGSSGHLKVVCEWIFLIKTFQIFFSDHVTLIYYRRPSCKSIIQFMRLEIIFKIKHAVIFSAKKPITETGKQNTINSFEERGNMNCFRKL